MMTILGVQLRRALLRVLLLLMLGAISPALAQTCAMPGRDGTSSSSGTVNSYYPPATGSYSPASSSIPLGTRRGAAVAVAPGDLVVVMQMQCASINTTNTSNYGAGNGTGRGYTDPAGSCLAGRYEYVRAGAATTNTSLDLGGAPLVGSYVQDGSTATNRRTFQVIRLPQHSALTLAGTVNAPYWDGQTGGVVLLDVAGALNWNGQTIDVAARGFRGAAAVQWTGTVDADTPPDFVATFASDQHATKGEGIAGTPRFILDAATSTRVDNGGGWGGYANGDQGRGAPGNAGGGGDNRAGDRDNGGGGGGGNGGMGGYGAYGWKSTGWSGTFTTSDFDMRGIGGSAFGAGAPNRVVMGGGGGAGGTNDSGADPLDSSGGAGGGIVIVRAGSMTGSGSVNAAGAAGRTNALQDGAGGGGAGGSVVLMTPGGGLGAVTVNAPGGKGGDSFLAGGVAHAGGGGGAGGMVIRSGAITTNLAGAINGMTNTGDTPVGGASHGASPGAGGTSTQTADSSFTTRPSAQCLPVLTVTKRTLTPSVSTATATSVSYTLVVSNSGGAATGADLVDNTLPPGWTFSQTSGLVFAPALSGSTWGGFVESTTPGQPAVAGNPGTAANLSTNGTPAAAPVWANLTIPGITGGTPGLVTLSFVVSLPASAPVGCFHNPAGVKYLDPTRVSAGREITPSANNTANRAGAQVGGTGNTSYETSPGSSSTVPGSNHSGLPAGPTLDDVCLQGDLSVGKTAPASLAAGQTLTYALSPRNNGRAIRDLSFSTDQATDASNASPTTRVLANGLVRVVDTLPNGITITNAIAPVGWSCSLVGQTVTCDSAFATPIASSTDLNAITGTVRISNTACSGPIVNTVTIAGFQTPYSDSQPANNTATASTTLDCNAALTVAKTNGTGTLTTGDTTTYTVTFANGGPSSADGAVVTDLPGTGLSSCSVLSCNASGGSPVSASCPTTPADLLTPGGASVPSLPTGGSLVFSVQCTVSASGT
jgi:uncharacterized repeat protein (TIGR01451 family)